MQGIIVLNKAAGFTSMDCCAIIRRIAHEKKVGHTGTLDPNATGVLPVCIGKATRLIEYMDYGSKTYIAGLRLGLESDTQDIWGTVNESCKSENIAVTFDEFKTALNSFKGDIMQIPPMYSAKKINGQKLYDLARNGQSIERSPQHIHIFRADLISFDGLDAVIEIECSRGTYIRTICADLGKKLGCGAVMTSLVRSSCGGYDISQAVSIDDLRNNPELLADRLLPIETAVKNLVRQDADDKEFRLLMNGNPLFPVKFNEPAAVFYNNKLAAITENKKIRKVFNDNF